MRKWTKVSFAPFNLSFVVLWHSRSQWPHSLRRWSATAHLLRLRVRIPSVHGCLSVVSVVCYQVEISASGWSLVLRGILPSEVCLTECDYEASTMRRPWSIRGCCATKEEEEVLGHKLLVFTGQLKCNWSLFGIFRRNILTNRNARHFSSMHSFYDMCYNAA